MRYEKIPDMSDPEPPPPEPDQFFIKTAPLPGHAAGRFSGLYLRQHSVASPAVVVTPGSPKFLRAALVDAEAKAGVGFTSWAPRHAGRKWGLVLRTEGGGKAGWERVDIVDDGEDNSLRFVVSEPGTGGGDPGAVETLDGAESWTGWMVCQWSLGHPQLFWITDQLQGELPEFCERVRLVREPISWPPKSG